MTNETDVIVNFSHVVNAFGSKEAVQDTVAADDDLAFARFMGRALTALEDAETLPTVMSAPDNAQGSLLQSFLAEYAAAEQRVEIGATGALEAKFDDRDLWGWIRNTGWPYIKEFLNVADRYPKPPWEAHATKLDSGARVALFGDWGTGRYGALGIRDQIVADRRGFDAVVHLGDVYYAGRKKEVDERMLGVWPWVEGAVNRACNSNHEMYSGGEPYFTQTLPRFEQPSSTFVLETPDWLVVGLDTAYHDATISNDQLAWLIDVLNKRDDRGVVLLSHHQLLSHHKSPGIALGRVLAAQLESRTITAWYWGHEHLASVYDPHPLWGLEGRCLGHGGYPYFRPDFATAPSEDLGNDISWRALPALDAMPAARFLDGPNATVVDDPSLYGPHGYVAVELQPDRLVETYVTSDGYEFWHHEIARPVP